MTEATSRSVFAAPPPPGSGPPDTVVRELAHALSRTPGGGISGTLLVTGDPGGAFHLTNGAIIAVESPGAPGVEALLLRSGRVSEADWAAAYKAGAAGNQTGAELVARTLVGTAELQLMCRMAALDGALAVGMGRIDGYVLQPGSASHHLATPPQGIEPDWLLRETERRIKALGSLRFPISPFRDRMALTPAGTVLTGGSTTDERREILLRVNGRRSPRDVAFLLGRSLYPVTVELSRMLGEGLVEVAPSRQSDVDGRHVPAAPTTKVAALPPGRNSTIPLPRREHGASGINDVLPLRPLASQRQPPSPFAEGSHVTDRHH